MAKQKEISENIQQAIDLIAAILRRIRASQLDKSPESRSYIEKTKGAAV